MSIKALFIICFLASIMLEARALQCYVCTSLNHTACEDPFISERAQAAGFAQTCDEPSEQGRRSLCRKTRQDVNGEVRVIRSCGSVNDSSACYSTRNAEVVLQSCQCYDDLCNSGERASTGAVLVAGLVLTGALLLSV